MYFYLKDPISLGEEYIPQRICVPEVGMTAERRTTKSGVFSLIL